MKHSSNRFLPLAQPNYYPRWSFGVSFFGPSILVSVQSFADLAERWVSPNKTIVFILVIGVVFFLLRKSIFGCFQPHNRMILFFLIKSTWILPAQNSRLDSWMIIPKIDLNRTKNHAWNRWTDISLSHIFMETHHLTLAKHAEQLIPFLCNFACFSKYSSES